MGTVGIRRVYEPSPEGTFRILVDRIWPRGLSKDRAGVDLWLKDVGPSDGLRTWFGHDPARFEEFAAKYRQELDGADAFDDLRATLRDHDSVDLVYSAKDTEHNQAVVLAELLRAR